MTRLFAAVIAGLALSATPARADIVILATAPDEYTPGQPFDVSVGLGPVSNLGLYSLDLVFEAPGPVAATLTIGPVVPSATGYLFSSSEFFLASPSVSGNDYRLTLSDFTLDNPGTAVVPGVNDRIATFTVTPSLTASGPIRLSVDGGNSFVDDADGNSLPLGSTPSFVINQTSGAPSPVPAPPGIVCLLAGGFALAGRQFVARRRPAA